MRIVRYSVGEEGPVRYGWLLEGHIGPLEGDLFSGYRRGATQIPWEQARMYAPVLPGKIVCVGRNFAAHAEEHGAEVPEIPLIFLKPPSSVIGPGGTITLPPQSKQVEHEAELAVVIGRRGRWVGLEEARGYVLGYTVANDVTARDLQRRDGQWTRAKGFDTFCPLGPWIETEFDDADVLVTAHVNSEMRQMASTRDMVFTVPQLIAYVSSVMTLEPGDVLLTGTPAGVGPLADGDLVEVSVEGIGSLRNPVAAGQPR